MGSGNMLPNYLLEGAVEFMLPFSSFILFDSFSIYVLGPIPGSGDIVVNETGKDPCRQKAYILGGGNR